MELIEVADQGFFPLSTASAGGQNLIFRPTRVLNDVGTAYEVMEEFPASSGDAQTSFVQVLEPSQPMVVNYIIDNTVTFLTDTSDSVSEPAVPSHILDHMYAKKPKEPGETQTRPRKRSKKKEQPPPVIKMIPDISTPSNTTKVNIIRKGHALSVQHAAFRQLCPTRPKILQNIKGVTSSPLQLARIGSSNDLSVTSTHTLTNTRAVLSSSPFKIATSSPSDPTILRLNDRNSSSVARSPHIPKQTPSIYFLPPRAKQSEVNSIIGASLGTESTKTSFIFTTDETEDDGVETEEFLSHPPMSVTATPSFISHNSQTKTDFDNRQYPDSTTTGQVKTFQLNSDGTISAVPTEYDEAVMEYTANGAESNNHPKTEMYNEFTVGPLSDDPALLDKGRRVVGNTPGGSFQLGDKQIFFSYE